MAAEIRLLQAAAADVVTPAVGKISIFLDSGTSLASYKDSAGAVHVMTGSSGTAGGDLTGTYPNPTIKSAVALTGNATAVTPSYGDNDTSIATTAFVQGAVTTRADSGNSSTAITIDWSTANVRKVTMTGNATLTFTAPGVGASILILEVAQDATGSRTITWPAAVHWSGGTAPTLTTTASKVDVFTFYYNGTTYFGVTSGLNYTA